MSWNNGFSRNPVLKLQNKLGLFHIVLQEKSQKFSLTVLETQNCKIWIQNHKFLNLSGLCIMEDEKVFQVIVQIFKK